MGRIVQGITLDVFPHVPASHSTRKSPSNWSQKEIREFMQKSQIEGEKRGREEELGE
jgi:hypothetical protein